MAKISLRTYIKDINSLIDQGLTEEALAHCKYILKLFPKYLEVYGALGKAYLESQRYGEASDILERILSANPDDFVSQVGLSIIREDENNLDAAIFHMERAYEIQSSNAAIQEELKRLYGRRDGITPHKIRISRGALVRMYLRGELYPQTIAEARVALQDDPNRPDIEIALAKAYYALGKEAEATEICQRLIGKLPYCLDANQIMASITENTRSTDLNHYRQKLIALDPYMEFCPSSSTNSKTISDDSILIDHLDWQSSMGMEQQPGWANMVGLAAESTEFDTAEWLNAVPSDDSSTPATPTEAAPEPQETEGNVFFDTLDLAASQEPNLDWLNEIADSRPDTNALPFINNLSESPSSDDLPDWLRDTPLDSSPFIQTPEESMPVESESEIISEPNEPFSVKPEENPDWFGEFANNNQANEQNEVPSAERDEEALPDWLLQLKNDTLPADSSATNESMPTWLNQLDSTPPEISSLVDNVEIPSFGFTTQENEELEGSAALEDFDSLEPGGGEDTFESSEELPDWLKELQKIDLPTQQDASEPASEPSIEAIVAGLETSAMVETSITPEEPATSTEEPVSFPEEPVSSPDETVFVAEQPVASAEESLGLTEEPETPAEEPVSVREEPEKSSQEPMSFTESPVIPAEELESSLEETEQPVKDLEPPVWINEFESDAPTTDTPLETVPGNSTEDVDAAMAWLESLAVQQGADPATLITPPEERTDTPPEWVLQLKPEDASEPTATVADQIPEISENADRSEKPIESGDSSILFEENEALSPVEEQEEKPDLDDLESWLRSLEETDEVVEESPLEIRQEAGEMVEELSEDTLEEMEGLEQTAVIDSTVAEQPLETEAESQEPADSISEWLKQAEEELSITALTTGEQEPSDLEQVSPEVTQKEQVPLTVEEIESQPSDTEAELPESQSESTLPAWLLELEQEETAAIDTVVNSEPQAVVEPQPEPEAVIQQSVFTQSETSTESQPEKMPSDLPNDLPQLLEIYRQKIDQNDSLDSIIDELITTSYRFPVEPSIWEILGDAYLQSGQIQKALDAYSKAEELLR